MNPPTDLSVVLLKVPDLDGGFLHNHSANSGSDYGRYLGWMPARQWYRIHPPVTFIHEVTVLNGRW